MADNTIDTLELQIESNSDQAARSLGSLAKKLISVNNALKSVNTGGMRNYARETGRMEAAAQALSKIKIKVPEFGDLSKQIEKISDIDSEKLAESVAGIEKLSKSISDIGNVNTKETGINNTINALKRLASADMSKFNSDDFKTVLNEISSLTNLPDVSSSVNRFVSSFARLAQAGGNTGKSASGMANLGRQLKKTMTTLNQTASVSDSVNFFTQAISQLANAGEKTGQTAGQLKSLAEETRAFFEVMKDAPEVSDNTIRMTRAIAMLSASGGRSGNTIKSMSSGFSGISISAKKMAGSIKSLFKNLLSMVKTTASSILKASKMIASGFSGIASISLKTESAILKGSKSIFSAFTGIGRSNEGLKKASSGLSGLLKTAIGFGSIAGIFNFGKSAIELGSNITEVENIVDVAFGSMADKAYEFASTATEQFGLSELAAKNYSGTMMAMLNSSGVARDAAAEMSTTLAGLAGDLASFYNIDTDEAFRKIRAGISGETEPLRQLGINMTVANLEAYALANGITKSYQAMTQAEQATLRYNYLMSVTAQQQGDFARTSGSYANQIRLLTLNFQSLSAVIGQGLIAAILPAIQALNALLGKLMQVAEAFRNFMYTLMGKKVEGSTGGIVDEFAGLGGAVNDMQDLGGAETDAADAAKDLKKALSVLPFDELNQLADSATDTGNGLSNAGTGAGGALDNLGFGGLDDAIRDLAKTDTTPISEWAERIRKAFLAEDWEGLGKEIADGLNKGMQFIYDAINWKNVGPKITKFTNAFTRSFNSLVDNLDFDLMGRVIGAGVNTLVNTFNQLIGPGGINFRNIGRKLSEGLRGAIDEINWKNLGNLLGNYFMISWKMLDGFITDMSRKSDAGLTGWQELGTAIGTAVNGIFDRINFDVIGSVLANGLNGAFSAIFTAIDTIEWNDIADKLSHGFNKMVNEIEWEEIGHGFGESFNTIIEALDRLITGISWANLGWKIADGLIEAIETINWTSLGNLLGDGFMIAWNMLGGFLTNMSQKRDSGLTGWEELGISIANTVEGFFDEIDFVKIADALTEGINGAFSTLQSFTSTFEWEELTDNIKDGIAEFLKDMDWEENGAALGQFLSDLCSAIKDIMTVDTFREIGDGIATFLGQLPWGEILSTAASTLINAFAGLLEGIWSNDDISLLEKGISTGFLLVEAGNITGIDTLAGKVVGKIGEKLIQEKNMQKLADKIGEVVSGGTKEAGDLLKEFGEKATTATGSSGSTGLLGFAKALGPLVGEAGLLVGVGVAATAAVSGLLNFIETMQGGNGITSEFGGNMQSFIQELATRGDIIPSAAEELFALKESLEKQNMTADEARTATQQVIDKLGEYGVTSEQAMQAIDLLRGSGNKLSDDMYNYLVEAIKTLGSETTNTSDQIDLSSLKAEDSYDRLRIAVGNVSNSSKEASENQGALNSALENAMVSGATAQDVFNNVMNAAKKLGLNTETVAQIFAEEFPEAVQIASSEAGKSTQEIKNSVDTNIVGAKETLESSMESAEKTVSETTSGMKSDAESNLSDVQGTVESSFGSIDDTTVLNWGNSAREVQVNLRAMKVAASSELAKMTETVRSYSQSMYNIMTEKFGYLQDEIVSIIQEMKSNTENLFDNMFDGLSNNARQSTKEVSSEFERLSNAIVRTVEGMSQNSVIRFNSMFTDMTNSTRRSSDGIAYEFTNLSNKILRAVESIKSMVGNSFNSMFSEILRSTNQSLNEIANMFMSLPNRIGSGMNESMYSYGRSAAQSFANGMRSVHIPSLEFYIARWKTHDLGNGGRTSTPVFKPNWYKVGGLFNGASVIGVGEAGKEAVLPLENKRTMAMIADSIISNAGEIGLSEETLSNAVARGVAMAMMNNQGNSGMPEYIQNSIYLDGDVMARAVTKAQRDRDGRFNPSPQFGY